MLNVIELFAGVGGFRIGLEPTGKFEVVWSNQWERSSKTQQTSRVYEKVFDKCNHSNENISKAKTENNPDADVLVGVFLSQDYSVANSLKIPFKFRKKRVLWWSIDRLLKEKKLT